MSVFPEVERTFNYVHESIFNGNCSNDKREVIIDELYNIIKQEGITSDEASMKIYNYACKNPKVILSEDFSFYRIWSYSPNGIKQGNLIDPEKFYYHNQLRVLPEKKRKRIEGTSIVSDEQVAFSLKIKSYYDIDSFLSYFYKKIGISNTGKNVDQFIKADKRRVESMLAKFDIDTLLFAVDIYAQRFLGKPIMSYNIFSIQDYIEDANFALSNKRSLHKSNNINDEVI